MFLDNKYKSIEIVLQNNVAANQMQVVAAFRDMTQFGASEFDTQTNNTTAVTIVEAPNQGSTPSRREVKKLFIYNKDTAANIVTIRLNNNGTYRELIKVILNSLYSLYYEDGKGFYILNNLGQPAQTVTTDMVYLIASGTDTYTATSGSILSLQEGMTFAVKYLNANTGAATLNINGYGAVPLKNFENAALVAGDIKAGQILDCTYDGTNLQIKSVTSNIVNAI
jgi:hypothetical protein